MAREPATAGRTFFASGAALFAALLVCLFLALGPRAAPAAAACPHAGAHPHDVTLAQLRTAVTCIVNHTRASHNRHRVASNRQLRRAAQKHDNVMLTQDCFKHQCTAEPGLNARIRHSGYTDGQAAWHFAEVLGYDNTPRQMMKRWLATRYNRRNLLKRDFRDIGVGVGWGAPKLGVLDSRFETFTLVLGWRRAQ